MTGHRMRRASLSALAAAGLIAAMAGCSGGPGEQAAAATQAGPGGPFRLFDTNGATVTEQTLKGKPYAMFFGFTRCPDVCPTTMSKMALLHKRLGADAEKMNIVFVSVDPEHDKKEDIASFLSMFDAPMIGLTGSQAELDKMAAAYKVYVERVPLPNGDYTIDHTARILLFDREGQFAERMDAAEPEGRAVARLKRLIHA
ncbi:SCO family protein [Sphingomonas jeddahensis]|uniref:Thioredoxin domain-containing protein n=1 Tax=Sphingomonas jeddahensis TaxID=1915074 RepID=A0A1V2ES21_9SPHN|nr:SCO family protein [Sphingomonas jeddahensis]ONF95088.1 hypothetical protein SPHI_27180 [Sphingomonas jeddahensis]